MQHTVPPAHGTLWCGAIKLPECFDLPAELNWPQVLLLFSSASSRFWQSAGCKGLFILISRYFSWSITWYTFHATLTIEDLNGCPAANVVLLKSTLIIYSLCTMICTLPYIKLDSFPESHLQRQDSWLFHFNNKHLLSVHWSTWSFMVKSECGEWAWLCQTNKQNTSQQQCKQVHFPVQFPVQTRLYSTCVFTTDCGLYIVV